MTIEWIQIDCHLDRKAETLEISEASGLNVSTVVGLLTRFWGWASLETATGTIRATVPRLCRMFDTDAVFWQAVETAGWLEINAKAGTITIPGWEKRFSKAAKSRACHSRRADKSRAKAADDDLGAPERTHPVRFGAPNEKRGKERRNSTSSTVDAFAKEEEGPPPEERWTLLRTAWNEGPGRLWTPSEPPDELGDRLSEPGWLDEAMVAIDRLRSAKYFDKSPVTLIQFLKKGFVLRINGGQYDAPPKSPKGAIIQGYADKPPIREFTGKTAEAFKRTREALARKANGLDSQPDRVLPPRNSLEPTRQRARQSRGGRDGTANESAP